MPTFTFTGRLDSIPEEPLLAKGLPEVRPKKSANVQRARDGAPAHRVDVEPDDVIELELADGLRIWVRAEDVERDFRLKPSRDAGGAIELPTEVLPNAGRSRGAGEWVIKGLKIFGIDIAGAITDFVASRVEGKLSPGEGLYRCTAGAPTEWPSADTRLPGDGPTLVFLHGTASSTDGSFGGLWEGTPTPRIQELLKFYDGRVLALQHRTLTLSPIENALDVAAKLEAVLPPSREVHLVSHSRGGLVGELLARSMRIDGSPFDQRDFAAFADHRARDRDALRELGRILERSKFSVTRFVRVACPARGTTLADGRLDRYFSLLTNVIGRIPFLQQNPIYEGITSLLAGVLKKRTDPRELPGLEAMMPGSALVMLLNRADVETRADLHVLGGDLQGTGTWGRLKALATDLFYLDDHDLVVNTPSMFGGAIRPSKKITYWIDTGGDVTHFNYFRRPDTAKRLVSALTSEQPSSDFHELAGLPAEVSAGQYRKRAAAVAQPVVFVLPGIMGSTLKANDSLVWVDYLKLATGGLMALASTAQNVGVSGLVANGYQKLVEHLAATHEVVPFPYDWRFSVVKAAMALRAALEAKLAQVEADKLPIRIIAHSMGGLVVRAMLGTPEGKATWDRMCRHPGARFVMLGTPNGGSHGIAAMLIGRDALTRKLALLDFSHNYADLLGVVALFDGVLELLPHAGTLDLYGSPAWDDLHSYDALVDRGLFSSSVATSKSANIAWVKPAVAQLAAACAVRDLLRQSPIDPARMVYVAGIADETPCDITIDPSAPAGRRVTVHATARGDGRVPWQTGIPAELVSRTYYMDAVHGDLANAEEHFPALVELLVNGATTKLPQSPPERRNATGDTFPMRIPMPSMVPDTDDLVSEALGGTRRRRRDIGAARKVRVRVVHGSLSRSQHPVLVGHYDQDVFASAERYLDRQLGGRLQELHRMDLYPGRVGTAVAVLNDPDSLGGRHPGALVAGLGTIGDLTPGKLTNSLANALTTYGSERLGIERRRRQRMGDDDPRTVVEVGISVLLIGSREGGVTLSDSLQAILRAVRQANERLRPPADGDSTTSEAPPLSTHIATVDILELYEDRAIQAVRALNQLGASRQHRELVIEELLTIGPEGQTRASFDDAGGWWQRVRVVSQKDPDVREPCEGGDALKFEAVTDRARAASYLRPTQRRLVDRFLQRAISSTQLDVSLGYTLFDLLTPPEFKQYAPDRRQLALLLDEKAASYPWELLHDRHDQGARPLAVESGMIRQLLTISDARQARPLGDCALVIGNPLVSDKNFGPLPGAEAEAKEVIRILGDRNIDVMPLIGSSATPEAIVEQLHAKSWRILHFAAHGVFEYKPTDSSCPVTGMVLDDGIFLTPAEIAQMRFVPDLVFINCCHLGKTNGESNRPPLDYHRLAANLATQLIRMGVRAVIAAGWAVDDGAAKEFAATFYEAMLEGEGFGDAVIAARRAVHADHPHTNTWGAYQCYGDAAFSLRAGASFASVQRPVAPADACSMFDGITSQAARASDAERQRFESDLTDLVGMIPPPWLGEARLCVAIGRAYAALKDFERAIAYYERTIEMEHAEAPLRAIEELANLMARSAPKQEPQKQASMFAAAQRLLDSLIRFGETGERYSLLGSLHKRRASALSGQGRIDALQQMADAYEKAYDLKVRHEAADPWYPLSNHLSAAVVLGWSAQAGHDVKSLDVALLAERFVELDRMAAVLANSGSSFFQLALGPDAELLRALSDGALSETSRRSIAGRYRLAQIRGGSAKEIDSVLGQIEFFEAMLKSVGSAQLQTTLGPALEELRAAMAG